MRITRSLSNFSFTDGGVTGRFDARLDIPNGINNPDDLNANARLTITLKVLLVKDNTGSGRSLNAPYRFAPWPDAAWARFQTDFRNAANFWRNKFWLVLDSRQSQSSQYERIAGEMAVITSFNPHPVSGGQQRLVYRRNIICDFNLELATTAGAANKTLNVQYIVDATGAPPTGPNSTYVHRSDASNVDVGDVITDSNNYNCIAHEVGHMIGMTHIGVTTQHGPCMAIVNSWSSFFGRGEGINANVCYDGPTNTYTNNIMGHGGSVDWRQALPWRKAFAEMSGVPLTQYIVHQIAYTPRAGDPGLLITEQTPSWQVYFPNTPSWWPSLLQ